MPDRNKQNEPGFSDIPLPPLELPSGAAIESVLTESDTSWRLRFAKLADNWRTATRRLSSVSQISMHPSYQRIIGMGLPAVPLILHALAEKPEHWLWALHSITGEDPAPENATFSEAVAAWLNWGRRMGYLTDDAS